jgi:hypothetical protein
VDETPNTRVDIGLSYEKRARPPASVVWHNEEERVEKCSSEGCELPAKKIDGVDLCLACYLILPVCACGGKIAMLEHFKKNNAQPQRCRTCVVGEENPIEIATRTSGAWSWLELYAPGYIGVTYGREYRRKKDA